MTVEDPLRALAEVHEPDARRAYIVGTLADEHAQLASIILNEGVPEDARQLFETAKNLSLYSWFVYRFHPVAEVIAFAALEHALNLRRAGVTLLPQDHHSPGLGKLLSDVVEEGKLKDSGFPSRSGHVQVAAEQAAIVNWIAAGADPAHPPHVDSGTLSAIDTGFRLTEALIERWRATRNHMAHGRPRLTPQSRQTLRLVAEALNQVFDSAR